MKLENETTEVVMPELGLYGLQQTRLSENLKSYLDYNFSGFPLHIAQEMIKSLLEQINLMHSNDFQHGDLKPANICVDRDEKMIFLGKTNCLILKD